VTLVEIPRTTASAGVVGHRQLVAVQTIDIARLPIQPVVITPSTFIAVSGWGPGQGSNESGKTSFQAAVALLCGDPEWWRSTAGVWATGLLFVPDVAGDGTGTIDAARNGYIVGVFADMADPANDQLTVWLRISADSPHLAARWSAGVHFAENWDAAEDIWKRLPAATEVGFQRYLETMFGGSHKCLAWVTKRGTQPSRPSLLSMTVDKRRPHEIGTDLLAVTGRADMLDREREQRRAAADADHRLVEQRRFDKESALREEADLQEIERRDLARQRLGAGERAWELHFARGLLDIRSEIARLLLRRRDARVRASSAKDAHRRATEVLAALGDGSHLAEATVGARRAAEMADRTYQTAVDKRADIRSGRDQHTRQSRELAELARQWDQTPLAQLEADERVAGAAVDSRRQDVAFATVLRNQSREAVDRLTGGGSAVMAALASAGVEAVTLGDAVVVSDRRRWEPLLHPWKEAAVISDADLDAATIAVGPYPGALLVHGPQEVGGSPPPGVATAPSQTLPFLGWLDAEWRTVADPDRVAAGNVQIIGGWLEQQLGADARRAIALAELREAEQLLAEEEAALAAAGQLLHAERHRLAAGRAHIERERILQVLERLDAEFAEAEQEVSDATLRSDAARTKEIAAATAQQTFVERKEATQREVDEQAAEAGRVSAAVALRHQEAADLTDRMLSYWLVGWGRSWREARRQLAEVGSKEVSSLRKDASEGLLGALHALRIDLTTGAGAPNEAVRAVVDRRRDLDNESEGMRGPFAFDRVAGPLIRWLAEWEETDRLLPERVATDRERRARAVATLDREMSDQAAKLSDLRDALERDIERVFPADQRALRPSRSRPWRFRRPAERQLDSTGRDRRPVGVAGRAAVEAVIRRKVRVLHAADERRARKAAHDSPGAGSPHRHGQPRREAAHTG